MPVAPSEFVRAQAAGGAWNGGGDDRGQYRPAASGEQRDDQAGEGGDGCAADGVGEGPEDGPGDGGRGGRPDGAREGVETRGRGLLAGGHRGEDEGRHGTKRK